MFNLIKVLRTKYVNCLFVIVINKILKNMRMITKLINIKFKRTLSYY